MKITKETIEKCNVHFISIEELVYIYTKFLGEDWDIRISPASISKLVRMGILKDPNSITPFGETVLGSCVEIEEKQKAVNTETFEEFWTTYPKDDAYGRYLASRMLRYNKIKTREAYNQAISSGISHEDIMSALRAEIKFRSRPSTSNEFKYMRNSINYFKDNLFLDYLETQEEKEDEYGKEVV